jgi:hypothetical protein
MPPLPTSPPCFNEPGDPLDATDELIVNPANMKALWDADLLDTFGANPGTVIDTTRPFVVRFRVELQGNLWRCMTGNWIFDLGFTAIGTGGAFDLSAKLPAGVLNHPNWIGCASRCILVEYQVPPNTVPASAPAGTLYEVGAKFQFHCCAQPSSLALAGFEALEERLFYIP